MIFLYPESAIFTFILVKVLILVEKMLYVIINI